MGYPNVIAENVNGKRFIVKPCHDLSAVHLDNRFKNKDDVFVYKAVEEINPELSDETHG